jgi:hypothetical protein
MTVTGGVFEIARIMLASLVTAHPPLDVLHARQPCPRVLIGSVPQTRGDAMLAPQRLDPLLAKASGCGLVRQP